MLDEDVKDMNERSPGLLLSLDQKSKLQGPQPIIATSEIFEIANNKKSVYYELPKVEESPNSFLKNHFDNHQILPTIDEQSQTVQFESQFESQIIQKESQSIQKPYSKTDLNNSSECPKENTLAPSMLLREQTPHMTPDRSVKTRQSDYNVQLSLNFENNIQQKYASKRVPNYNSKRKISRVSNDKSDQDIIIKSKDFAPESFIKRKKNLTIEIDEEPPETASKAFKKKKNLEINIDTNKSNQNYANDINPDQEYNFVSNYYADQQKDSENSKNKDYDDSPDMKVNPNLKEKSSNTRKVKNFIEYNKSVAVKGIHLSQKIDKDYNNMSVRKRDNSAYTNSNTNANKNVINTQNRGKSDIKRSSKFSENDISLLKIDKNNDKRTSHTNLQDESINKSINKAIKKKDC